MTPTWLVCGRRAQERVIEMARSFDELVRRTTTPQIRRRAARRTRELLGELLLAELRESAGQSQRQLATVLGIKQPSLSKLEKQSDMQISTLQRIIAALGGELQVVAKFPGGTVKLEQFNEPAHSAKVASGSAGRRRRTVLAGELRKGLWR
jgi:transcriptional regulator with XRE-family HTH domain